MQFTYKNFLGMLQHLDAELIEQGPTEIVLAKHKVLSELMSMVRIMLDYERGMKKRVRIDSLEGAKVLSQVDIETLNEAEKLKKAIDKKLRAVLS